VIAVQFVLVGIIWGSSFLFMKVALGGISPRRSRGDVSCWAAATLGVFVLVRRDRLPARAVRARVWGHMTVLAVTFCVVPFCCSRGPSSTSPRASGASTTRRHRS
jgi:drug/metabolite transporter (DMT)-like permease